MADNNVCCICGKPFDDEHKMGNNAEPFRSGRCCNKCNKKYVIPSRMFELLLIPRVCSMFKTTQKEIETGETKLPYNTGSEFGYSIPMKGQPKELKEWERKCFLDFCKDNKKVQEQKNELIKATKAQLKDADDVWVEFKAEKEDFYFILWNVCLKRYHKEKER